MKKLLLVSLFTVATLHVTAQCMLTPVLLNHLGYEGIFYIKHKRFSKTIYKPYADAQGFIRRG